MEISEGRLKPECILITPFLSSNIIGIDLKFQTSSNMLLEPIWEHFFN